MKLTREELDRIARGTLDHYDQRADDFWTGTRDHDVRQNIEALLQHIEGEPPNGLTKMPGDYFYATSLRGVLELVQLGALELHVWGSHAKTVERPDLMIFDVAPKVQAGVYDTIDQGTALVRTGSFSDPNPDTLSGIGVSLRIVFAVVLGGMYSLLGSSVGTALTIALSEFLRIYFGIKLIGIAETIYGLVLILCIIFLPSGIYGSLRDALRRRYSKTAPA